MRLLGRVGWASWDIRQCDERREDNGERAYKVSIRPKIEVSSCVSTDELSKDLPKPKIPVPIIGIIQCICAWADQPYQLQNGLDGRLRVISVLTIRKQG